MAVRGEDLIIPIYGLDKTVNNIDHDVKLVLHERVGVGLVQVSGVTFVELRVVIVGQICFSNGSKDRGCVVSLNFGCTVSNVRNE